MGIANIEELSSISGSLNKDHRDLGELQNKAKEGMKFFKYIRNKYVGHFTDDLSEKTFEWMPFSYQILGSSDLNLQAMSSWFALETVINTYTDGDKNQKIFGQDMDLIYPPDQKKFFEYLGVSTKACLEYIERLIDITRDRVDIPDVDPKMDEEEARKLFTLISDLQLILEDGEDPDEARNALREFSETLPHLDLIRSAAKTEFGYLTKNNR